MINAETPLEELTHRIIGAAVEVHSVLGPGLLESVYQECLTVELSRCQLDVERERHVPVKYKGQLIQSQLKLDLLVEGRVVVEVKAAIVLKAGLKRLDHPDLYVKKVFS